MTLWAGTPLPSGGNTVTLDTVFTGNTTIYAHWKIHESSGGGNGGDSDPTYSITLPGRVTGGSVTATKRYAEKGETFRFTAIPDEGWELDTLTVTDRSGKKLEVTDEGAGVYSFKMPAGGWKSRSPSGRSRWSCLSPMCRRAHGMLTPLPMSMNTA